MKKIKGILEFLGFYIIVISLSGCASSVYYEKVVYTKNEDSNKVGEVLKSINADYYYVVHCGDQPAVHLKSPLIDENDSVFGATEEMTDAYSSVYTRLEGKEYARCTNREAVDHKYNQIHIFTNQCPVNDSMQLAFSSIKHLEKLQHSYQRSGEAVSTKKVVQAATIIAIPVGIYFGIKALCGCPEIYTNNHFQGNLYSGAIKPSLERDDYIIINTNSNNLSQLKVNMANNKNEYLFTNNLSMIAVSHDSSVSVLVDQEGNIHSVSELREPIIASSGTSDQLDNIRFKDDLFYVFDQGDDKDNLNNVNFVFSKPKNISQAKLVVNVKNSHWFNLMFNEMCGLFGDRYEQWYDKKWNEPADKSGMNLNEQGLYIQVYIKKPEGLELIDQIKTVGSLAFKEVIIPIDLSAHDGDNLEIILKSGFRFWDLDYVGVDYTENALVDIETLTPVEAKDSTGVNYLSDIACSDEKYLEQTSKGHNVEVTFLLPSKKKGKEQTFILHGEGYYKRLDKYEGKTKFSELMKIKKKGGMSKYSKERFLEFQRQSYALSE